MPERIPTLNINMEGGDIFIDSGSDDSENGDLQLVSIAPGPRGSHLRTGRLRNEPIHIQDDSSNESVQATEVVAHALVHEVQILLPPSISAIPSTTEREGIHIAATVTNNASSTVANTSHSIANTSHSVAHTPTNAHNATHDTSLNDFAAPKKYKPKTTNEKDEGQGENVDDDAECCPICFERWENSGSHRLASLKCGHLFGQSCIEKWLYGQGGKCPQCNAKASKKDIRLIYAKALKMLDTTERDHAITELERERTLRQKVELETAQLRLNYQMALDECKHLREEVERQNSTLDVMRVQSTSSTRPSQMSTSSNVVAQDTHNFVLEKTIKISEQGNCRVMDYCSYLQTLCISQPSASPLFPGFGVKKLSAVDFKTSQYVGVHTKQIRDIVFNPANDLMLTASMDKTVKLTSLSSNSVVQTYTLSMPVWSCAYNLDDSNYLYAGLLNGSVAVFDVRNTSQCVKSINTDGARSPVVALHYLPVDNNHVHSRMSGVLIGQLNKCSFYELQSDDYKPHILPIDGSVTSVALDIATRHALFSYRPNSRQPCVRHQMCAISTRQLGDASVCSLQPIHTFNGGSTQTLLSRSRLVPHPREQGNLLVCASDEASCSVHVWEATTGAVKQRLTNTQPIMDVCHIATPDKYHLCSLNEKQLLLYTWK